MPASIADLLRRADLGMTLLAGEASSQLTEPIRWVTTSELVDPTPYLRGGELLLTTGMRLRSARFTAAQYVSRLADAGVVGIGIGVGRELAYRRAPARLVSAAAERGLPLLLVDEPTPFIAIGEAVAQLHLADETAELAQALRGQQAITRAAVTHGAEGVIRRLAGLIDGWALLTDADGSVRYEYPPGGAAERGTWRAEISRMTRETHSTASLSAAAIAEPGEHVAIQVLGAARGWEGTPAADTHYRGFLVTGRAAPPRTAHHSMTNVAAALLTVSTWDTVEPAAPIDNPIGTRVGTSEAILATLGRFQRRSRVRLDESLRVWLQHHGRVGPAARQLGIHRNTLTRRVARTRELLSSELDLDLADPAVRADLWAALSGAGA